MRRAGCGLVCALLLTGTGAKATEPEGMEKVVPKSREELEAKIREVLQKTKTPGVGYAVVTRDGVTFAAGVGKADVAAARDATGDTLFRIGSISKMFVSLSVLMLQEEGKLALDDVVRSRIPDIAFENPWEATDPIRIVNLLEHTTGFDDLTFREYAHSRLVTLKEGLDYEPRSRKSRWRPGTRFSYCNSGPPMAAYAIEKVTGRRFEDFVQERFFAPLEMKTATYFKPMPAEAAATLYHPDGTTPYPYWEVIVRPSGSINASAAELGHLAVMLLGRGSYQGTSLLPPAAIDRLEHPTSTYAARAGMEAGYGLGNYASFGGGFELHGHNGGVEGGLAHLAYIPEAGVGFVAMINSGSGDALENIGHLIRNFVTRDLQKPAPPLAARVPAALAHEWSGYYLPASPRQEMFRFLEILLGPARIRIDGDTLAFSPLLGKADHYVAVTERTFRKADHPAASLVLLDTPEGRLVQLEMGQTARPVPAAGVLAQTGTAALCLVLMASAPIFALVWIPRRFVGRLRGAPHLGARAVSLLAVLCLCAAVALFIVSDAELIPRFGNPTVWSVAFCALTVAFAVLTTLGLWLALRLPKAVGNRWARLHTLFVAGANSLAAVYLLYWGIIGLRSWM